MIPKEQIIDYTAVKSVPVLKDYLNNWINKGYIIHQIITHKTYEEYYLIVLYKY